MVTGGQIMMLVDGNSLAHRAFHALPPLSNRQGVATNAVYGFTNMLSKALHSYNPGLVIVAFDKGRPSFRQDRYQAYKGTRQATPEDLRSQFPLIKKVLQSMRVAACELEGYEADDLIGTLTRLAEETGCRTLIVTGDRDALQLVSNRSSVLLTKKGITEVAEIGIDEFRQQYGLEPVQLIDLKGLMGDASDNIPGVPGIGEKTAIKLIKQFGSIENLLLHVEDVKEKNVARLLNQYAEQARLSKELATIDRQVPLELDLKSCSYGAPDYRELLNIFQELDFHNLVKTVLTEMKDAAIGKGTAETLSLTGDFQTVRRIDDLEAYLEAARKTHRVALSLSLESSDYLRANVITAGLCCSRDSGRGISFTGPARSQESFWHMLWSLLADREVEVSLHDAKETSVVLRRHGISLVNPFVDTMLAAYLLNPSAPGYALGQTALEHLNRTLLPREDAGLEAAERAAAVFELASQLPAKLAAAEMSELYTDVEVPLVGILADMEWKGVRLDQGQLEKMGLELGLGIQVLAKDIYALAGEEFNINSPRQLGCVLFEKLGLPASKKTKTGYSTSAEVLEELAPHHEIVGKVIEYRLLMKLKSTYVDGLRPLIVPETSKVHTTFNQMVTATGRLSSAGPNLQNIPVRLELGRRLRKVFIPSEPSRVLFAADYSQIELRVLAHISGDEGLIHAFQTDQDIHTHTASEVFGVPLPEVTPEQRRRAKAVNFGIVYGISDYGLARDLGITRQDAREYIGRYFLRYPGVQKYLNDVIARARLDGYVTTLLRRRRYLPDLFSSNFSVRGFGERTAMNTPIQGSAADIIKLAMLRIDKEIKGKGMSSGMILQVHDELIFDVPVDELPALAVMVKSCMEGAFSLSVPLKVELKKGPNWYDMSAYELK